MFRTKTRVAKVSPLVCGEVVESLELRVLLSGISGSPSGLSPAMIEQAYDLKNIVFTTGGKTVSATGAGETIAIVDAYGDPDIASDLETFDSNFGLTNDNASGQFVLTVATPEGTPRTNAGWATEQSLDVEWAHAIAPQANILLVEANSADTSALTDAVVWAEAQSGVVVVSMSWGSTPEFAGETAYDPDFTTPSGHAGVTFVASSGDNAMPNYPSTSPNVLAVGGTTLTVDDSGDYLSESPWDDSGGGVSPYEHTHKPDVAYDANPSTGFLVYDSIPDDGQSGWEVVGGTSAGSPQWAAIIALVDQGRSLLSLDSLDGPTQTISQIDSLPSSDFNKVSGDGLTGLGSPVGEKIISTLVGGGITSSGAPAVAQASISGSITIGGAPVPGATVYLDNNNDNSLDDGEPSTLTNSAGDYSFTNLPGGTYIVRQILPTGDKQNSPANNYGIHITLASGESSTGNNFLDTTASTTASISGIVEIGGAPAAGVTVYLDNNNDNSLDNAEPSTVTNSAGAYSFTNLQGGTYIVRQILPEGDKQTSPADNYGIHITLASGESSTSNTFIDTTASTTASIWGIVEIGGSGLAGVTVYLDNNNDDSLDDGEPSTVTNSTGAYTFGDLSPGTYVVRQILPPGYQQVTPTNNYGDHITLSSGQVATGANFSDTSIAAGSISGEIFNDANGDGKLDDGETGLSDWQLYIDLNNTGSYTTGDPTTTTNSAGDFTFSDLPAGTYIIRVMRPSGWTQTVPTNNFGQHLTITAGQNASGILFGEKQ